MGACSLERIDRTALVTFDVPGTPVNMLSRETGTELLQQFDFVHGGVLSYAADNAITFAAGTVLGPSIVTTGFTVDYLRPAKGVLLRAEAAVVESTKRQALCRCEIVAVDEDGTEKVCAAAQGSARLIDLSR